MKTIILAGGFGTHLSKEIGGKPKPMVDTDEKTMARGRIKRVKDYIGDETFCFTYGDGVTDLNRILVA